MRVIAEKPTFRQCDVSSWLIDVHFAYINDAGGRLEIGRISYSSEFFEVRGLVTYPERNKEMLLAMINAISSKMLTEEEKIANIYSNCLYIILREMNEVFK